MNEWLWLQSQVLKTCGSLSCWESLLSFPIGWGGALPTFPIGQSIGINSQLAGIALLVPSCYHWKETKSFLPNWLVDREGQTLWICTVNGISYPWVIDFKKRQGSFSSVFHISVHIRHQQEGEVSYEQIQRDAQVCVHFNEEVLKVFIFSKREEYLYTKEIVEHGVQELGHLD